MTIKKEIEKKQSELIKSFETGNSIIKRRIDTEQIWVNKNENIADAVIRKRVWKFGIPTFDFIQVFHNDVSLLSPAYTGFKRSK